MGVHKIDKILVGSWYSDLEEFIQAKAEEGSLDKDEVLENYFDYMSPFYDSDRQHWFVGLLLPNATLLDGRWFKEAQALADEFEELTGVAPIIHGGGHVY